MLADFRCAVCGEELEKMVGLEFIKGEDQSLPLTILHLCRECYDEFKESNWWGE